MHKKCYMSQASYSMFSSCNTFQRSRLNWTTLQTESCYFGPLACAEGSKTITFDTGIIHSHNDLGINANYQDRLGYRRVTKLRSYDKCLHDKLERQDLSH